MLDYKHKTVQTAGSCLQYVGEKWSTDVVLPSRVSRTERLSLDFVWMTEKKR